MNHRVRIVVTPTGFGSQVFIDDHEIQPLQSVTLQVDLDRTRLTPEFAPCDCIIEGEIGPVDEVRKV
jgi:hypothetical protein